ncbi:MAG: hypothetical protein KAI50_07675, partial [Desulfobacterales bacterium]|nr:hypothetical protein [Desulfobacterales bacterium]
MPNQAMHIERKGRGLIANYTFCIFSVLVANYESGAYRTWGSTTNQPRITQLTRRNGGKLVKVREICGKNSVTPPSCRYAPMYSVAWTSRQLAHGSKKYRKT